MLRKLCPECNSVLENWVEVDQVLGVVCPKCEFMEQTHELRGVVGNYYSVPLAREDWGLFDDMDETDFTIEEEGTFEKAVREIRIENEDEEEMPF